jgi:hypothetical protein
VLRLTAISVGVAQLHDHICGLVQPEAARMCQAISNDYSSLDDKPWLSTCEGACGPWSIRASAPGMFWLYQSLLIARLYSVVINQVCERTMCVGFLAWEHHFAQRDILGRALSRTGRPLFTFTAFRRNKDGILKRSTVLIILQLANR